MSKNSWAKFNHKLVIISIANLLLLTLSSCGLVSNFSNSKINTEIFDVSVDTKGQLIPISSDNVSMASYDLETRRMTVVFHNGKSYWYQPVEPEVWSRFYMAQPHPWSKVGYPELVLTGLPYGRLN